MGNTWVLTMGLGLRGHLGLTHGCTNSINAVTDIFIPVEIRFILGLSISELHRTWQWQWFAMQVWLVGVGWLLGHCLSMRIGRLVVGRQLLGMTAV